MGCILAAAVFLRFFRLDALPPGLHYDEAAYGMLASDMLHTGQPQVFFRAYAAREPLFVYFVAASIYVFGQTSLAMHLVAATVSSLTVLFTYLFGREAFGSRIGLIGSALMAVSYWQVHTGRLAFRAITVPLLMVVTAWLLWVAFRKGQLRWYVLAGILGGLTFYTYIPARFFAVVIAAFWASQLLLNRRWLEEYWQGLAAFCLVASVVAVPLGVHYIRFPEDFFVRFDQSSVFTAGGTDKLAELSGSLLRTAGMFSFQGDIVFKYNLPGRPVFDWLASAWFYLGLVVALWRFRRPEYAYLLLWMGIILLPGAMTVDSPHFLRTLGAAPPIYLLPAIGLIWLCGRIGRLLPSWSQGRVAVYAAPIMIVAWLSLTGLGTFQSYFLDWGQTSHAFYAMEGDVAAAAAFVQDLPIEDRVYFSSEHYRHPSVAFLAGNAFPHLKWFDGREVLPLKPGHIYVFPYLVTPPELDRFFPPGSLIAEGKGPAGETSYTAYRLPAGGPKLDPQHPISANLGDVVELLGYGLANNPHPGDNLELVLYWRALRRPEGTLGFSLQIVDEKGRRWGQRDPGSYLSDEWEPGETVVSWHKVGLDSTAPPGKYFLEISVYDKKSMQALPVRTGPSGSTGRAIRSVAISVERRETALSINRLPMQHRVEEYLTEDIELLGYNQRPSKVKAGEKVYLTLFWRAADEPDMNYEVVLRVVGVDGQVWQERSAAPVDGQYPTRQWAGGEIVRDEREMVISGRLPAGTYQLQVLLRPERGLPSQPASLGSFVVETREHQVSLPPVQHTTDAQLGDFATLIGYDLHGATLKPGGPVHLTLYWRAESETEASYKAFVHLLGPDNRVWGQHDSIPGGGKLPTTGWVAGEVITDEYRFTVDRDAPAGHYWLEAGLYEPETGKRLPVPGDEARRVLLTQVEVTR